jgi:hypothetical protein
MEEDVRTKIQQIGNGNDHWMLSSDDAYVIEQYRAVCENEGKTVLEKCGVFDSRKKVESILSRLRERPVLWGQDPDHLFLMKYGV